MGVHQLACYHASGLSWFQDAVTALRERLTRRETREKSAPEYATPTWPDDQFRRFAPLVASEALELVLLWRQWVHRRVETVEFLDHRRIRRRISADFTLPSHVSAADLEAGISDLSCIPLALMAKRPLHNFDAWDERGDCLTTLTRAQNALVSGYMLIAAAEDALGDGQVVTESVAHDLMEIVAEPSEKALRLLEAFEQRGTVEDRRGIIWRSPTFRTLATDLAANFLLFILVSIGSGDRRIIKFGYDEVLSPFKQRWYQWLRTTFAFRTYQLAVPFFGLGRASSYHVETCPADSVFIDKAELWEELEGTRRLLVRKRPVFMAHLYVSSQDAPRIARETVSTLEVTFNLHPSGLVAGLFLNSVLTTTFLWAGWWFYMQGVHPAPDSTPAVIAVIPAIFSAYLVRPGEHELVRRMFLFVRLQGSAMSAVALGAAALLSVPMPEGVRVLGFSLRVFSWSAATAVSSVIMLLLGAVIALGLRRQRTRVD